MHNFYMICPLKHMVTAIANFLTLLTFYKYQLHSYSLPFFFMVMKVAILTKVMEAQNWFG